MLLSTSSFTSSSSPSLWDRLSTWASENKAAVYTIAGVAVVVTGAGVVYYLSDSRRGLRPAESSAAEEKKKQSKKDRRKAKKQAEEAKKEVTPKSDTEPGTLAYLCSDKLLTRLAEEVVKKAPTVETEDELPQVDESTVESLSEQVRAM
jgi:import receptor subunit TOM70